jgi:hypothetical protein
MTDIWPTKDPARSIGCAVRAGTPIQRNEQTDEGYIVPGFRAALSRFLRRIFGERA